MSSFTTSLKNGHNHIAAVIDYLQPLVLLTARIYVAWVFFKAGLTKINDWETTLLLFEYEYAVPFISFELAAYLGTAGELVLPVLLAVGLLTRFSAIGLSIVNIVAVISLPDMPQAAYNLHIIWGLALVINLFWGGGKLSTDHALKIT
ncbi:DoxX family protein [Opacimonas viscosa]|uniref:DoxX family protein n=1 Tax=Opacimonas viscosa TaxID=2961944 RepID=A0AA42BPZ8_9ALTE|nr:DoxX family protein [Opacimonas viscosa]MCP3428996.1 DoxX family protein [Opacimonas viscosa]